MGLLTVLFLYLIAAYLSYHGLWNEMNLFELVMLWTYIGLQAIILVLGIFVYRTHHWMWHVLPGFRKPHHTWPDDLNPLVKGMYAFYDNIQWIPVVRRIVLKELGPDIGLIVMEYVEAMTVLNIQLAETSES